MTYLRGVCRVLGYDLDHMRTTAREMGGDPRALFDKFDYERTNQLLIRQFADRLDLLHDRLIKSIADALPHGIDPNTVLSAASATSSVTVSDLVPDTLQTDLEELAS